MNPHNIIYLLAKDFNYDVAKVNIIGYDEQELAKNFSHAIRDNNIEHDYTLEVQIPVREEEVEIDINENDTDDEQIQTSEANKNEVRLKPSNRVPLTPTQSSGSDYIPTQSPIKKGRTSDEKKEKIVNFFESTPPGQRSFKKMNHQFPGIIRTQTDMKKIYEYYKFNNYKFLSQFLLVFI